MRARLLTLAVAAALLLIVPAAARAAPDLVLTDIAPPGSMFNQPVYVTSPPDDPTRLFVVEQGGTIQLVHDNAAPSLFLAPTDVHYGAEQGLLSMAFAPDYKTNGRFYVYYNDAASCNAEGNSCDISIYEYRSSGADAATADPGTRRLVLRLPHQVYGTHNGGQMQFGPDGYLYVSTGDGGGGGDPEGNAQNRDVLLGKLLRIDPRANGSQSHTSPSDNPFVGPTPGADEIWAYGLRNPWRFSVDAYTGKLAIGDVGQDAREEVDFVSPARARGANFGWNQCEGEIAYPSGDPCPLSGAGNVGPVLTYGHDEWQQSGDVCGPTGASIIGGVVVRDLRLPSYAGRYFFGDWCHQYLWTADLGAGSPAAVQDTMQPIELPAGMEVGARVTSIDQDAACRIYITSGANWVRRVDPAPDTPSGPDGCAKPPPPPPGDAPQGGGGDVPQPESSASVVDRTPPVVTGVAMARDRFAVAGGPTAIDATGRGTAFRFTLSERGVVTIGIERARLGRRVGRRCLAATRARRRRPGCTRLTAAGVLTRGLAAGRRSVPFSGRLGRRPLVPGHYRATITERDSSGNVSRRHTLHFTVLAR